MTHVLHRNSNERNSICILFFHVFSCLVDVLSSMLVKKNENGFPGFLGFGSR